MTQTTVPPNSTSEQSTRRSILSRAAAVTAAAAMPGAALAAEPVDPHHAWLAEWKELLDWCNGPGPGGRDLVEFPQWYRVEELEELISSTPTRTLAGARDQLRLLRHWCTSDSLPNDDMDAALENALATIERLAGSAVHG
jgi:hypothetical protein